MNAGETREGLRLEIGPREGSYPAWWKDLHFEIYGWKPTQEKVFMDEKITGIHLDSHPQSVAFDVANRSEGLAVVLE